jgi:hypothetical protein
MNDTNIYSCEYKQGDYIYSLQIVGTLKEAQNHADNLGLSEPELVNANIPVMNGGLH